MSKDYVTVKDVSEAITSLHQQITKEYMTTIASQEKQIIALQKKVADLEAVSHAALREAKISHQESTFAQQELASVRQESRQLIAKRDDAALVTKMTEMQIQKLNEIVPLITEHAAEMAAEKSSTQVLAVVKRDIMPPVNKAMQWLAYHTQDTDTVLNDYRQAVMESRGDTKQVGNFKLGYN